MTRASAVLPLITLLATCRAAAQDASIADSFAVPAGCSVSLWAESPLFYNPTAIDIDPQGRVWVTEAVNYRQWEGRNPGLHHDEGDRVMVVEDRDGDGVAETSSVFAQDKDLVSPLGICWLPDKVLVSCSPTVWAYYDDDHDLKADRKEVFLTGFGGWNHDHGAHSFTFGPDGRLYMALGNAGPHVVTDKSGWTLRSGSIYDDGGPFPYGNKPGLVSDDGRVYVGGLILSCNIDGTGLAVMAHNFRNPYEVAVDAFGDMWTFDNDDDGNQCCRATWVMEGGNYGYFSADGTRFWQADRRPGQSVQRAHWHQDDPGVMPTTLITGSGGPTGVCVYEGDALPEPLRGALLCADAGRSCVFALTRAPDPTQGPYLWPVDSAPPVPGLTPQGEQLTGLLVSKPAHDGDDSWHCFRPSDVCVAPDGSVLVADWFDPGVGGHRAQDQKGYGRLLRITADGHEGAPAASATQPTTLAEALDGLKSPAASVRASGWLALKSIGPRGMGAFEERLRIEPPDSRYAARLIWARLSVDPRSDWSPQFGGNAGDWGPALAWMRAAVAKGLPLTRVFSEETLLRPELDPALVSTLRGASWKGNEALYGGATLSRWAWLAWEGKADRFAAERRLVEQTRDQQLAWSAMDARLACWLHPESLAPAFSARVMSTTLDRAAREQSLTALAFCTSREAAEAMLNAALAGPADTRDLAAWWIEHNDLAAWRDYALAQHLAEQREWTDTDIVWRSGPVTGGSVPVEANVSGSRRIALVVTASDNGNGCDWADWLAPELHYADTGDVWSLAASPPVWESAVAEWGEVQVGRNCDGGPLSVDGQRFEHGIGTHARSDIVFAVPYCPGVKTTLVGRAAVDDGGTGQPSAPTKVEFIVYADRAAEREWQAQRERQRLDELFVVLRDPARALDERTTAGTQLALDPQGGARIVAEAQAGQLGSLLAGDSSDELVGAISDAIFRNADPGVRALASEHFQRPGSPALPPVADILQLAGERHAGQGLFFGSARCDTCHAVNGRGGDVGPDLSQIRTKYGRPELLDSILNPSAAIGAGFESVTLTLQDGSVLAGFLQADGAQVLLKDATGKRHVVEADDIAERRSSKLSLMPDDIAYSLTPQQLADLCAFLQHDPTAPPKLGAPLDLWNGHDLSGWIPVPDASAWSVRDIDGAPVLHCEGQPVGYIRSERPFTSFELTVEWRFPDPSHPGNSGVLLRVQPPDKVWPRSLEAQLNSGDAGDIWNIDEFGADLDPARTDGRRTVKLLPSSEKPLGEWNTYRITLRDGDLTLEVNGQVQNRARWCEELPGSIALQSEGAPIEFRRVTVREIEN